MDKIELGKKVRCKITGFTGIVVARTEFINGCVQYSVAPKVGKDNRFIEDMSIDENSLEEIKVKKKKVIRRKPIGGATTRGRKMRGF